ncbi:protein phosphatase 2C 57-like [Rosa rugosa]|uniref:protein phosphatase 2C 57-like n=1 Tax=Rosa rugosa TaxID=74645 RepID=UPI002B40C635|nr:protein phosphatase 2C 57-like [Rosa rugosa]
MDNQVMHNTDGFDKWKGSMLKKGVTASPDVYQASLGADSEFLVLASDGLWDYINSSDAVSFVRNQLRQHGDVQLACYALAEAALATTN